MWKKKEVEYDRNFNNENNNQIISAWHVMAMVIG